ncbi:MAG: Fic family protein [Epsilonproteobacteria bacterium]|nr:Fic family protein [Campylobacterota bacterium]
MVGKEKVYYEAPSYTTLDMEMKTYIEWFNKTPASLIKSAISHLWFVIIHPFDDGNGRLTRLITDMVLSELEA